MAHFWRTNQTLFTYSVCIIEVDLYLHVTFDVKATSSKSSIGKYYFFKSKYLILRNKKVLFLQKKKELSFFQRESSIILKKNILALRNESIIFVESIIFLKKVLFFSESITFLKKVLFFSESIIFCKSIIFVKSNNFRFGAPYSWVKFFTYLYLEFKAQLFCSSVLCSQGCENFTTF